MVDKVILDIHHSDDYTDYLLMTAGLKCKRIIPVIDARPEEIKAKSDTHTLVLRCYNSRKESGSSEPPVQSDIARGSIRVLSRYYLNDDGTVNAANAELVRQTVEELVMNALLAPANLKEVYRQYFPLFWAKRQQIYANPKLFFASSGRYASGMNYMPIGAVLKAIEDDPKNFRIRLGGGCTCGGERPFLIGWDQAYGEHWTLYTWCPVCQSRREIRAWNFQRAWNCERSIEDSMREYDKGQGLSALSLFDVLDAISAA